MFATSKKLRLGRLLPFVILGFLVAVLSGCGDDSPGEMLTDIPEIAGAFVPETAEEGEPISVEVWGQLPHSGWSLEGFDVEYEDDGIVTITPISRLHTAGGRDRLGFHGTATIDELRGETDTIRIRGAKKDHDFPIHVYPRQAIVRLLVRGGSDHVHEELVIGAPGWAMAFRRGEGQPVRVEFSHDQLERVRQLFDDAGFFSLDDRYLSEIPNDDLFYQLSYREADRGKEILAEFRQSPEALVRLVGELRRLIVSILQEAPSRPPIVGSITVRPVHGEQSQERTIVLTLQNRSREPQTLEFPDAQQFDIAVLSPHWIDDIPPDDTDPDRPGENPPGDTDPPERLIWNWAFDKEFVQVLTLLQFRPEGEHSFEIVWDCTQNGGASVRDGIYRVVGIVPGYPDLPIRLAEVVIGSTEPPPIRLVLDLDVEPVAGPAGTERELRFTILNRSEARVILDYPDNQHYDFHIFGADPSSPEPIWSWSHGEGFTDFPTVLVIEPRERIEFVELWDGEANDDVVVGPGIYHVRAVLTTRDNGPGAIARLQITE